MYLVGGTFDENGGKTSYIIENIGKKLNCNVINGGHLDLLRNFDFSAPKILIWMPNISNQEDKILSNIKKANQKLILVSSKRVIEKDYTEADVIGKLLATKSNLGIMITKNEKYQFKVLDPLGNIWADTEIIPELCDKLHKRVSFLTNLTRIGSEKIGEVREFGINKEFLEIVKRFGNEFAKYVNAVNPNRFLGNAATRCSFGFPSLKEDGRIFVTRRNVDKGSLQETDFVEVEFGDKVGYYGDIKPSVDTPIQLKLFEYYQGVNYMLHGHVYVQNAPFTAVKLPCGSIEEFEEIKNLFPEKERNFVVNLLGHGFLAFCSDVGYLNNITLKARPFPEV